MNKISGKMLIVIAVILSLVTSLLVYKYLKSVSTKHTPANAVAVVVAKADIPPKTKITPDMVQTVQTPKEYIQPGAVSDLNKVIGIVTREAIVAGEQVTEKRLVIEGKTVGFTGIIPKDKRAVTISANEVSGVSGFLKAGDYVDIVITFDDKKAGDNVSHILLQNILVLAVNREADSRIVGTGLPKDAKDAKDALKVSTVTVAVTPEEAAKIVLAEHNGKINLALRPYLPTNEFEITNPVTPTDIVGVHTSPMKNSSSGASSDSGGSAQPTQTTTSTNGVQVIRGTKIGGEQQSSSRDNKALEIRDMSTGQTLQVKEVK